MVVNRSLVVDLEDDGVAALFRLYADAYDVVRSTPECAERPGLLDDLLASFLSSDGRAWERIFAALHRIEPYAERHVAPSSLRIRAFLAENADLSNVVPAFDVGER